MYNRALLPYGAANHEEGPVTLGAIKGAYRNMLIG